MNSRMPFEASQGLSALRRPVAATPADRVHGAAAAAIVAMLARLLRWAAAGALAVLAGCSTLPRNGVPPELMNEAVVPGLPQVRAPAGRQSAAFMADLRASFAQESAADFPLRDDGTVRYSQLALSGGGANGAFGAGFLNGWTQTGRRPVFKIVTGVSTGALIAPFAFVGPDYDDALREFYTTTASRNIFRVLSFIPQLLGGESFAETGPLRALLETHVDAEFLQRVARAHAAGRRLYIGTANLDAQQFVVWNMGLIAASGRPDAIALFRQVMLASASIPVAFPPVLFDVTAGGRRYDEMHVDGGVGANVFYSAGVYSFAAAREGVGRGTPQVRIFVIHNGQLAPTPEVTTRSVRAIAMRSFDSAMKAAFVGDLFRIYGVAVREKARFNWISIPDGVELGGDEAFDPVQMRALYDLGLDSAKAGRPWSNAPPGFDARPVPDPGDPASEPY